MSDPMRRQHPRKADPRIDVDLAADGVLFMINAQVFHPRGFALSYEPKTGNFYLLGDGSERWRFAEDADAPGETADNDAKWAAFNVLLDRARSGSGGSAASSTT